MTKSRRPAKGRVSSEVGYDTFSEIYDIWVSARPIAKPNLDFYINEFTKTNGLVVDLGVGTGRVAIEAAKRGRSVTGVDSSRPMLDKCAEAARAAGVAEKITLLHADFRDFTLSEKAGLIAIPFHGIGHLISTKEMARCFKQVHGQLKPGGRLIFDHILIDLESAKKRQRVPHFRCEYTDAVSGTRSFLWAVDEYNFECQTIRVRAWTEALNRKGEANRRKYYYLDYGWVLPDQFRALLTESGFHVEASYGDYFRGPLTSDSKEQIWIATKK